MDNVNALIMLVANVFLIVICQRPNFFPVSVNLTSQTYRYFQQVNLANLLNKPIIPILIDKMSWPPEGSMSMLFAQLLYIQFYNDQEYVRGEKFWDDAKFAELLAQVNYHAVPDADMITDGKEVFVTVRCDCTFIKYKI